MFQAYFMLGGQESISEDLAPLDTRTANLTASQASPSVKRGLHRLQLHWLHSIVPLVTLVPLVPSDVDLCRVNVPNVPGTGLARGVARCRSSLGHSICGHSAVFVSENVNSWSGIQCSEATQLLLSYSQLA